MRKLSFPVLGLMAMLLLVSCSKDDLRSGASTGDTTGTSNTEINPFAADYSEWESDESLTWTDGTSSNDPQREAIIGAPITQEMIDNGRVLVFVRSNTDGSVKPMPARFYDAADPTNFDSYELASEAGSLTIKHSKVVGSSKQMPSDADGMSFRYIAVSEIMPPASGRIPTNDINTIEKLRTLSYDQIVEILGIPK